MNHAEKTEVGKIYFSKLVPSTLSVAKKDKMIVAQDIVRTYAAARGYNSHQMSVVDNSAFGKSTDGPYTSIRKAFVDLPLGTTEEQAKAFVDAFNLKYPTATVYSIMSNDIMDVLTDEEKQQLPINEAQRAQRIAKYRARFEMQNKKGECFKDADGKFQYRRNFLNVGKPDVDLRGNKQSQNSHYRVKTVEHVDYETGVQTPVTSVAEVIPGAADSVRTEAVPA
jgi:RNase P/RNase MRP subunit p29